MPRGFQTEHGPRQEDSAGRARWGGPASPKSPEVPAPAGVGPQSRRGWKGLEADGPRSVFTLLSPTLTSSSGALAARGFYGTEAPWGLSSRGPPGVLVPGTSWGSRPGDHLGLTHRRTVGPHIRSLRLPQRHRRHRRGPGLGCPWEGSSGWGAPGTDGPDHAPPRLPHPNCAAVIWRRGCRWQTCERH